MWDAWDAAGTHGHFSKYVALFAYLLCCLVGLVGLNRLFGLEGAGLLLPFLLVAGGLLWGVFLPLFRRLHASPSS
jgi:hypothetical protein